jgi:hypothetical protein
LIVLCLGTGFQISEMKFPVLVVHQYEILHEAVFLSVWHGMMELNGKFFRMAMSSSCVK